MERHIAEGRDVVLEIEVQGAMKIRESFPEAVFVFILPPSYGTLHERLAGRGTETPEAMEARLRTARFELSHAAEYDYVIVNDDVEKAREQLGAIITAAKCRTRNMKKFIDKVCEFHEYA